MRQPNQNEWSKILNSVRSYCSSELDAEDIAQNIWLESLKGDHAPTRYEIRLRCIDAIRRFHRDDRVKRSYASIDRRTDDRGHLQELLDRLVANADLSDSEKQVLVKRFYNNQNIGTIATETSQSIGWVNETLWTALEKLRSAKRRAGL